MHNYYTYQSWLLLVLSICFAVTQWSTMRALRRLSAATRKLDDLNDLVSDRLAEVSVRESLETRRSGTADEAAVTAMALTIAAESLSGAHAAMTSAVAKLDELKKIQRARTIHDPSVVAHALRSNACVPCKEKP
jgi:hypothetical protein